MPAKRLFAAGLGSNVGDRMAYMRLALAALESIPGVTLLATSRLYESKGWGRDGLDPFLNAVVAGECADLRPEELLREMAGIEDSLGRQRTIHWGPRTLDLDLLAVDDETRNSEQLQLPHPWIAKRPFVYKPLGEVADLHPAWAALAEPHPDGRAVEPETVALGDAPPVWGRKTLPLREYSWVSAGEEETAAFGRQLAWGLGRGSLLALSGGLGAGKSVLARAIAREMGVTGPVQSPTFTLCREYETSGVRLEHWDLYRVDSEDELESAGFFSPESEGAIRLVEWPERCPAVLDMALAELSLEETGEESRRIRVRTARQSLPFAFRTACPAGVPTT